MPAADGWLFVPQNFADVLFRLVAGDHHLVTAAGAAQARVHTDAQNLKGVTSAGVILFHFQNVADPHVHDAPPI